MCRSGSRIVHRDTSRPRPPASRASRISISTPKAGAASPKTAKPLLTHLRALSSRAAAAALPPAVVAAAAHRNKGVATLSQRKRKQPIAGGGRHVLLAVDGVGNRSVGYLAPEH